jgi:hypothetical protein
MISWFGPQNQVGFGLSVVSQNQRRKVNSGRASRSSGLLRVEASLARVFQSGLKTGGWCTWHHRGGCVEGKLKTDESMRRVASNSATISLSFSIY